MNDYIERLRLANKRIAELDALVLQSYVEGYSDALNGDSKLTESWKNSATMGDLKAIKDKS